MANRINNCFGLTGYWYNAFGCFNIIGQFKNVDSNLSAPMQSVDDESKAQEDENS